MPSQGSNANKSGKILEGVVSNALIPRGFDIIPYREWIKLTQAQKEQRYLIKNAPYISIYKVAETEHVPTPSSQSLSRSEFIISDPQNNIFCRVECKWQAVSGSVDEKLPYVYLNAIERWEEKEIIILIDGKGWKKGALYWLKKAVETRKMRTKNDDRKIMVMDMVQFQTWCQSCFS